MLQIKGRHTTVDIHTDVIDELAQQQLQTIADQQFSKSERIRVMPDVHAGKGSVIGFTSTYSDKIVPNIVGVDIGCGVLCVSLGKVQLNEQVFQNLDVVIRQHVPCGTNIHETCANDQMGYNEQFMATELWEMLYHKVDFDYYYRSIGTLGGGNHYIEVNVDEQQNVYLVIHSGSRHLGVDVCNHYQRRAVDLANDHTVEIKRLVQSLKEQGKHQLIESEIAKYKQQHPTNVPTGLEYLTDIDAQHYLHDHDVCKQYATLNRHVIAQTICRHMEWEVVSSFESVHNYVDTKQHIIRKGAISAQQGERVIIPINMRDGAIIGTGLGNWEYNYSAPHGAGRLMSRKKAHQDLSLDVYKEQMAGIWSSCVNESTLDESPMAYKAIENILDNIVDTVKVDCIIRPVYNFKASE